MADFVLRSGHPKPKGVQSNTHTRTRAGHKSFYRQLYMKTTEKKQKTKQKSKVE